MSELESYYYYEDRVITPATHCYRVYHADDADNVISEHKARIAQLKDDNALLRKNNAELRSKNEGLLYALADAETDLAMATRWRKVSEEFPSADEGYFIALWEDGLPDICYIGAEDDVIETIRDRGEGHSVEWWMPLTQATKEIK